MSHADFEQLASGYVLGALEPDDENAFARHLGGCTVCQASVQELEAVLGELAWSVPQVEPPRALRTAIRKGVGLTARGRGPRTFRVHMPPSILSRAAVAVAAVLVFALAFWNMSLRNQNTLDQRRLLAFETAAQLLNDGQAAKVPLSGESGARATVVASTLQDRGVLVVEGLPKLPADRVWQLWTIPPGAGPDQAVPGQTWISSDDVAAVPFGGMPLEPNTTYGVTSEPRGGSRHPTPPMVLQGQAGG
jgi:anti-sigma-K factor RskA